MSDDQAFDILKNKVLPSARKVSGMTNKLKKLKRDAFTETTKRKTLPKSPDVKITDRDYVRNIIKAQAVSSRESVKNVQEMHKNLNKMTRDLLPKTFQGGLMNRITDVTNQAQYNKMVDIIMERAGEAKTKIEKKRWMILGLRLRNL